MKEQVSKTVSMYTAEGDTTKRWFIYFNAYNPLTLKEERVRVYGTVNSTSSFNDRIIAITELNNEWKQKLDDGYNYFTSKVFEAKAQKITLSGAAKAYLFVKKSYLKPEAYRKVDNSIRKLLSFYNSMGVGNISIAGVERSHAVMFRTFLLEEKLANKTINIIMSDVRTFFNYMENEDVLEKNPFKKSNKLPERPYLHEVYTEAELKLIFDVIRTKNINLHLFCKFICYTFLRPNEIINLKVKNFDLDSKEIVLQSENSKTKRDRRPIPYLFLGDILSLNLPIHHREDYIFTLKSEPGPQRISPKTMGKYFTKIKKSLGFGKEYTMYGLKHTFVCHLIKNGADREDVMRMTGHTTYEAFEKYLRSISALPAKDLSSKYTMTI